jgi:hypothetical protein
VIDNPCGSCSGAGRGEQGKDPFGQHPGRDRGRHAYSRGGRG